MYKSTFFTLLIITLLWSCNSQELNNEVEEPQPSELSQKIDNYIDGHITNGKFKGSVLITRKDSILFQKSYGLADIESNIANADSANF